jgi:D-alanyl-D-alanine carboxypeptidase
MAVRNRWRRLGVASLALAFAAMQCLVAPALARGTDRHAVLVVDANTGRVIYQSAADEPRYPASLAKLMTLYLIFELIDQGRLSYRTKIRFSANAVAAQPSKLDVEEGDEITLIEAIKALITKSCNDVAVAVAEHIAGSEWRFAQMMTQKARELGMQATTFRNASGLPDAEQVTTARDMVTLALRLHDDFPQHYPLFATRTFTYAGNTYRNHNKMLFNYAGTDGLKTGYTRASGFNLVASVRRGRKHVVGAVFGVASAASRNSAMRTYMNMGLIKASNRKTRKPARSHVAQAKPKWHPAAPVPRPALRRESQAAGPAVAMARVRPVLLSPDAKAASGHSSDSIEALLSRPAHGPGTPASATTSSAGSPPAPAGPFQIQVGAFQSAADAERHLASVRQRAGGLLGDKAALTSAFRRGDKVFYRARYAGFEAQAAAAGVCAELKRLSINCLVMRAE